MKENEPEVYLDGIVSNDAKVPTWLKWVYGTLPFWGLLWLMLYWNGSHGILDRGYWNQLQKAANTTMPFRNVDETHPSKE